MPAAHDLRGVLRIRPFRRLWIALSLSSFGDWLGLLATTALAAHLSGSFAEQNFAIGGVFFFRLLPAVVFGPLAGAFADRFDRRKTMVTCDVIRCVLIASIALFHSLPYLFAASFLIESASLFWIPAKEASVPNLVERRRLESANQLSLIATYGSAPVAALFFAFLAKFSDALGSGIHFFSTNPTDLALYLDAATFLVSASTVATLREISGRHIRADGDAEANILRSIAEGWRFVAGSRLVRGLVIGILGGFAASACVIALARPFSQVLGGGDAGYGLLFGAVFTGLALGMFVGPRLLRDFSRLRLFGLSLVCGGVSLAILAILPNLALAVLWTVPVGAFAGIAWVVGYTLLGGEVDDAIRGRTFALVQSLVRIDMLIVIAAAPLISGAIGAHSVGVGEVRIRLDGATATLFGAGLLGIVVGIVSYRQMDDREVPLWRDLMASLGRLPAVAESPTTRGTFVVFEGGDGAGKSTQVRLLTDYLRDRGVAPVVTREPGATALGGQVRAVLLDRNSTITSRAEALLYAADRADHVEKVIRPALERGDFVISDRYIDSTLAYQGAGRDLAVDDLARISRWATDGLVPDLTVLLDVTPETGLNRSGPEPDRLEAEPNEFHERVRHGFRELAERDPARYLVVDAALPITVIAELVRARVTKLLPPAPKPAAETAALPIQVGES
jgi:dTMP kinase